MGKRGKINVHVEGSRRCGQGRSDSTPIGETVKPLTRKPWTMKAWTMGRLIRKQTIVSIERGSDRDDRAVIEAKKEESGGGRKRVRKKMGVEERE